MAYVVRHEGSGEDQVTPNMFILSSLDICLLIVWQFLLRIGATDVMMDEQAHRC